MGVEEMKGTLGFLRFLEEYYFKITRNVTFCKVIQKTTVLGQFVQKCYKVIQKS